VHHSLKMMHQYEGGTRDTDSLRFRTALGFNYGV
jgi:hypothetical protein